MEPAQTPPLITAFIELIPVIGGAIIGVIGGLSGTAYAHRLSSQDSKNTEIRTKLESLVADAYELDVWMKKEEDFYLYGASESIEKSPLANIEAITSLYFIKLDHQVSALSKTVYDYKGWILDGAKDRIALGTQTPSDEHMKKIDSVYRPFIAARKELVNAARDHMDDLLNP